MELRHFLYFLNAQLEDCESSIYCNTVFIKDALPGFKKFVVEFMLKMAKVVILHMYSIMQSKAVHIHVLVFFYYTRTRTKSSFSTAFSF